ncbi:MAG: glycoside hydrolase family 3, partial [Desulfovibrionales bacterium]|nr:glycoside hydrolase family 3 [Desulfovibrionales bacterium]
DQSHIVRDITELNIGGVILFDYDVEKKKFERNVRSPEQLEKLVDDLSQLSTDVPLLVAIDQEGGRVSRLKEKYGFKKSVSQAYLGEVDDITITGSYALETAQVLSELGINLNFAPVVDLNTNPDNPVIGKLDRSFSNDPQVVVRHSWEVMNAHRVFNVLTAIKHFPGHGSSREDSHLGFVDVTETWDMIELEPFRELISDPGCDMVMTAHIFNAHLDPDWPATMSKKIIGGILRGQLGYDGVVVSDDMQMKAIREHYSLELALEKSIMAGVDIIIFGNNLVYEEGIAGRSIEIIKSLVDQGRITHERINESYERIEALKSKLQPVEQSNCSFCIK